MMFDEQSLWKVRYLVIGEMRDADQVAVGA